MNASEWASTQDPITPPSEFHCPTSDVWQARFTKLAPFLVAQHFDTNAVSLFASIVGEIGDNCFTHNAPSWIDIPGCWFGYILTNQAVNCVIADRGRGILASLSAVRPTLKIHRDALLVALTEQVSGRAPEQRGNGLKFVMNALCALPTGSFILQSGSAQLSTPVPLDLSRIAEYITESPTAVRGTYSEITIQLPYAY